ncbi:MAG: DUF945 family protein [Lautropia sp.]|nr:DUF945 family protein [Lautropia sp.]
MGNKLGSVVGGVVVLGLAYGGASWWLGSQVERQYQAELEKTLLRLGASKVLDRSYQRGVFEAQATTVVEVKVPAELSSDEGMAAAADGSAPEDSVRVHLVQKIRHGPFADGRLAAAVVETRVAQVDGVSDRTRAAFAKASPPVVTTVHDFSGGLSGQAVLPAGEISNPDLPGEDGASWQTLTYDFSRSADHRTGRGLLDWPGGTWQVTSVRAQGQPAVYVRLGGIRSQYDVDGNPPDRWVLMPGRYRVEAGLIEMRMQGAGPDERPRTVLSLADWRSEGRVTQQGSTLVADESGGGKAVIMDLPLERLSYVGKLDRFDQSLIQSLQELIQSINRAADPAAVFSSGPELEPLFRNLLASRPGYSLRIEGVAEGSKALLNLNVDLQAQPDRSVSLPVRLQVLQALQAEVDLQVPKKWQSLLEAAAGNAVGAEADGACLLDCWAAQGLLQDTGYAYTLTAGFGARRGLLLNGKPLM